MTLNREWLNKSFLERCKILEKIAPAKAAALGVLLDEVLRME